MKLFINTQRGKKYLNGIASTRGALANKIGSNWFIIDGATYSVDEVYAEEDDNSTAAGAVIGGLIGLLAGPVGVIGGGVLGGLIGSESDNKDNQKVKFFNNSRVLK